MKVLNQALRITVMIYALLTIIFVVLALPFATWGLLFGADPFLWHVLTEVVVFSLKIAVVGFLPMLLVAAVGISFLPPPRYVPPPRYHMKPEKGDDQEGR